MADRFFFNDLQDYDPNLARRGQLVGMSKEEAEDMMMLRTVKPIETPPIMDQTSFRDALSPTPEMFLKAGVALKEKIKQATWSPGMGRVQDPTMYTGLLGTAYLCWKSYRMTGNKADLACCTEIVDSCAAAAAARHMKQYVTFLCGQAGIYALGAAAAACRGDKERIHYYLKLFNEIASQRAMAAGSSEGGLGMPYELLYGRAGFLYACLFINKYVGEETIPWTVTGPIVHAIMQAGRAGASQNHKRCPLMYQWHGTRYWGAAHGLAGIINILLYFPLSSEDVEDVKATLRCMMKNRFFPSGNYPSSEGNNKDKLVHWCHGAPGMALTLCKAAEVFPKDSDFVQAAVDAGDVVWSRGLLRRIGLCHGVTGNTYTFLALYRLTEEERHRHRARAFAGFLHDHAHEHLSSGAMHGGDHPNSLFEGLAGTACLYLDMSDIVNARFPGFEL